jgi:hypothetical protein
MKRIRSIIGANRLAVGAVVLLVAMVLGFGESVAALQTSSCYQPCTRPGGCTGDCPTCVIVHPDVAWCAPK